MSPSDPPSAPPGAPASSVPTSIPSSTAHDPIRLFTALLGHPPTRPELVVQALTHRSAGPANNERLEFLGDAVLGLIIAEALLARFPNDAEGALSRYRAALVNKDALATVARRLRLGDYLALGTGELRSGGHTRDSILADAFEALLGAIYLDQGHTVARDLVLSLFAEPLAALAGTTLRKDPKTRLQEWLQSRRRGLPEYAVIDISGDDHAQRFRVRCRLTDDGTEAIGEGHSRRRAEQQSAETMLATLGL